MGIDGKYGRVTLERVNTIAEDEPVVVFRAQDKILPQLLMVYWALCRQQGAPQRHLDLIERSLAQVEDWQESHYTQIPQSRPHRGYVSTEGATGPHVQGGHDGSQEGSH